MGAKQGTALSRSRHTHVVTIGYCCIRRRKYGGMGYKPRHDLANLNNPALRHDGSLIQPLSVDARNSYLIALNLQKASQYLHSSAKCCLRLDKIYVIC